MRSFVVFHHNYVKSTRSIDLYRFENLHALLDFFEIDYGEEKSEKEAVDYINYYNGDGDDYWMISELSGSNFHNLVV